MSVRRTGTVLIAAASVIGLAACGSSTDGTNSTGAAGSGGGGSTINVGIKFDQPGMGLKAGSEYTGYDVTVAKYIANKLGKTPNFVEAVSSQRETLIQSGQVDYIVGTYSITDARKAKVDFAGPYFVAGQDLLVRTAETAITGPDALAGKKLCSVKGSTSASNLKKKYPDVDLQEYATYSACATALVNGSVDALTTDDTILAGYASQAQFKGKVKLVGKTFSTENYGVGFKKGDSEMCKKITDALKSFISDGSWQKAVDANLAPSGFKPGPGNPPTPAACS